MPENRVLPDRPTIDDALALWQRREPLGLDHVAALTAEVERLRGALREIAGLRRHSAEWYEIAQRALDEEDAG
jgi:hypothetical protein